MEDMSSFWAEAPAAQVAQLIGHKGEGGLYALLRRKGWAHQLVVSNYHSHQERRDKFLPGQPYIYSTN